MKKIISIVIPCFNEEGNVKELYLKIKKEIASYHQYEFEIVFIDNASTDNTLDTLKSLASSDETLKIIVNLRNFGPIRSPCWALMQVQGAAAILIHSDLQCPPALIPLFINSWELGWKVVFGVKKKSKTNIFMYTLRKGYYRFLNVISEVKLINDATGFGLYDRDVLENIREVADPYPYLRGLVCEFGYPVKQIPFEELRRHTGKSKMNLYALYGDAMLGIVNHSTTPIRMASIFGFLMSAISFSIGLIYLVMKLVYWDNFALGIAPLVVGTLFLFGVLFVSVGIIGEYIASIQNYVRRRPMIIEKERINF